jgi:hypothetical protein
MVVVSRFEEYADALREQREDFVMAVAAGVIEHRHPLTREQAAHERELEAQTNERLADLFDNDNPESLWYG